MKGITYNVVYICIRDSKDGQDFRLKIEDKKKKGLQNKNG